LAPANENNPKEDFSCSGRGRANVAFGPENKG